MESVECQIAAAFAVTMRVQLLAGSEELRYSFAVRRNQLVDTLQLAWPVIIAELGWMFMGVVDTLMVGSLGSPAIGAVGVGNAVFDVAGVFGIGLLLGLDTLVSQSHGAGKNEECDRWLWQGLLLAAATTPMLMLVVVASIPFLQIAGVQPQIIALAEPYTHALNWSVAPLLIYSALRRYLQAMGHVRSVMFALVTANLVNAGGNALLIPRYGVEGAGWATCGSRIYMAGALALFALLRRPALLRHIPRPEWSRVRELLRLGLPAAGQILLEVGVFATATVLAGKLAAESLAAHHIVLMIAGTTFMVPLGVSGAGAVTVGQAIGRGDLMGARRAGWLAIALGCGLMALFACVLAVAPRLILGQFTKDPVVLGMAVQLVFAAAIFQIFDGIQVTATGVLRGAGQTRTPMYANLVAHWLLGLPAGYILCFVFGFGVVGLWAGLSTGLISVALVLLYVWRRARL